MPAQQRRAEATEFTMIMAQYYLARYETPFAAYMAFQRALLERYLARGGTMSAWCDTLAPVFRRRYGPLFSR